MLFSIIFSKKSKKHTRKNVPFSGRTSSEIGIQTNQNGEREGPFPSIRAVMRAKRMLAYALALVLALTFAYALVLALALTLAYALFTR